MTYFCRILKRPVLTVTGSHRFRFRTVSKTDPSSSRIVWETEKQIQAGGIQIISVNVEVKTVRPV